MRIASPLATVSLMVISLEFSAQALHYRCMISTIVNPRLRRREPLIRAKLKGGHCNGASYEKADENQGKRYRHESPRLSTSSDHADCVPCYGENINAVLLGYVRRANLFEVPR